MPARPLATPRAGVALLTAVALLASLVVLATSTPAGADVLRDVAWVRTGGSQDFDYGRGVGLDDAGDTYVAAQVSGASTFTDPTSSSMTSGPASRSGVVVIKYTTGGEIAWVRAITSTTGAFYGGLSVTPAGEIVVAGSFTNNVSFGDPPNDLTISVPASRTAGFVARYDAEGTVQWTRAISGTDNVTPAGVSMSAAGITLIGTFAGTASATSTTGTITATAAGTADLLVAHLDANGFAEWMTATSVSGTINPRSVSSSDSGDAVVVGSYNGTVTWGATGSTTTSVADDVFIAALGPTGTMRWVQATGSAGTDQAWSVDLDPAGTSATVAGYLGGRTTFGAGGASITVTPTASPSAFVARFGLTDGSPVFAKAAIGPGPSMGTAVAVDTNGTTAVGGAFAGPVAFGLLPAVSVTSTQLNGFVATFDGTGAAVSAFAPSGPSVAAMLTFGVAIDGTGTLVTTGTLHGSMTFAGRTGSIVASDTEGHADVYVARLPVHVNHAPAAPPVTISTIAGDARAITLAATDPDGDAVTYGLAGNGPAHGSVSGTPPALSYQPDAGYEGTDTFGYTVTDPEGATSTGTVTVDVLDPTVPPQADAANVLTSRNRVTPIQLHGSDAAGGPLSFAVTTPPAHGSLSGVAPNLSYTPATDYLGADSFDFQVTNDRSETTAATITITVKQPNVVMIMTDDQTLEQQRWLPRTNALLGGEGTTFSNFIVSYSECCPSRATFLSGQYAHNHGVLSSALPTGGVTLFDHANSLAPWLQANGYYTALSGKYMNGYGSDVPSTWVPPGWSDWYALYEPNTYEYFDYDISANGVTEHHARRASDYSTDVLANHVDQQIRSHGGTAQPFFIDFTPTAPHVTRNGLAGIAAPRDAGTLVGTPAPRPPSFNNVNATLPAFIRALPAFSSDGITGIDNVYRIDAETMLSVDDAVEKIYDALRDTGELDNTIIMFTSDNGNHFGDRRMLNAKSDPYEETVHVPLLVRGPGFPAGAIVTQPTANIDLAPTVTAATGTTPGRVADGVPLTNFVTNASYGVHRTVIVENGPFLSRRTYKGIRDDRYVYIAWNTGEKELYDLATDPFEMQNLAYVPSRGLQLLSLDKKLRDLQACAGAACRSGLP